MSDMMMSIAYASLESIPKKMLVFPLVGFWLNSENIPQIGDIQFFT